MLRTFAIALLAAGVIAAPAMAQNPSTPTEIATPAKAPAAKTPAVKVVKAVKGLARHHHKLSKHVKHVKYAHHHKGTKTHHAKVAPPVKAHVKHAPVKHVAAKPVTPSGSN
jgi:hypothetical protein